MTRNTVPDKRLTISFSFGTFGDFGDGKGKSSFIKEFSPARGGSVLELVHRWFRLKLIGMIFSNQNTQNSPFYGSNGNYYHCYYSTAKIFAADIYSSSATTRTS